MKRGSAVVAVLVVLAMPTGIVDALAEPPETTPQVRAGRAPVADTAGSAEVGHAAEPVGRRFLDPAAGCTGKPGDARRAGLLGSGDGQCLRCHNQTCDWSDDGSHDTCRTYDEGCGAWGSCSVAK